MRNPATGSRVALGCAALACVAALLAPAAQGRQYEVVDAVWKPQQVNFEYRGDSTLYSCDALERKLEKILESMGAREDVRVGRNVCDEHIGVARFHIRFSSPVEATQENIRLLTTYRARDELIARVRGAQLAAAEDLPRFPAVWKTVTFARDRSLRLQPGDCELVQQVRSQILAQMSVRILTDRVRCSSAFGNIGPPRLTVAALVPAGDDGAAR